MEGLIGIISKQNYNRDMNKETLAKAKQLEEDILLISNATKYYRTQLWSHWDYNNDRPDTFHFDFCKNYSGRDCDCIHLPRWMNRKLMAVLYQEKERLERDLDALGNEGETKTTDKIHPSDWQPADSHSDGEHVVHNGVEYEFRQCTSVDGKHKARAPQALLRLADRMASWVVYSLLFCLLFCLAGWQCTTRELIALSLALGLFAGSINNIERVLRELFERGKKE